MSLVSRSLSSGIGSAVSHFAQRARSANQIAGIAAGAAVFGTVGAVGGHILGEAYTYQSQAGTGMAVGLGTFAAGATAIGLGRGAFAAKGFKNLLKREYAAGNLLAQGVAGAGLGLMTSPTDSTLGNLALGATMGIAGGYAGRALSGPFGGATMRKHTFQKGGKLFKGKSFNYSPMSIGNTAGVLFSPVAAHALIGGSRNDKRKNVINRF